MNVLAVVGLWSSPASAQLQELLPPPGMNGLVFGAGLAAQDDTAVAVQGVGTSLHVHERLHGAWHWTATVALSPGGVIWGSSRGLALDGDWVAATGKSVYLFERRDGLWLHAQTLDMISQDSVALSGSTLVVGSTSLDTVHVFELRGGVWTLLQQLQGSQANEEFGNAVAVDGEWMVVGSPMVYSVFPDNVGRAYLYRRSVDPSGAATWVLKQTLKGGLGDGFGRCVEIEEAMLAVGAPGQFDTGSPDMDKVWVYRRNPNGAWSPIQKLIGAPGVNPKTRFGVSLALTGRHLVVGSDWYSPSAALAMTGAAYHYRFNGSFWVQVAHWLPMASAKNDRAGSSVAIAGSEALVGAPFRDTACGPTQPECNAGAVWVHDL